MAPGDFIITPSWTWHRHTHEGDTPMIWLDGLDNGLMT
jgi:gentisate 1,2-dioxygenase